MNDFIKDKHIFFKINICYLSGKSEIVRRHILRSTNLYQSSWDSNIVYTDIWKSEFGLANKVKRNGWKEPVFKRLWPGSSSSFLLSFSFVLCLLFPSSSFLSLSLQSVKRIYCSLDFVPRLDTRLAINSSVSFDLF